MVRRLTVLQNPDPEDQEAAERSPRAWVGVGAILGFTCWLPLVIVAQWLSGRLVLWVSNDPEAGALALLAAHLGPLLISLVLATGFAGALVGRFGGRARALHAGGSGLLMAAAVALFTLWAGSFPSLAVALGGIAVLLAVSTLSAWLGGLIGVRRRPRG